MAITLESSKRSAKQTATLASVHFFKQKLKDPVFAKEHPFNDESQFAVATVFYTWLVTATEDVEMIMMRQSQLKTAIEQMEIDKNIITTKDVLLTAGKLLKWIRE